MRILDTITELWGLRISSTSPYEPPVSFLSVIGGPLILGGKVPWGPPRNIIITRKKLGCTIKHLMLCHKKINNDTEIREHAEL